MGIIRGHTTAGRSREPRFPEAKTSSMRPDGRTCARALALAACLLAQWILLSAAVIEEAHATPAIRASTSAGAENVSPDTVTIELPAGAADSGSPGGSRGLRSLGARVAPSHSTTVVTADTPMERLPEILRRSRAEATIVYVLGRSAEELSRATRQKPAMSPGTTGHPPLSSLEPPTQPGRVISYVADLPGRRPAVGSLVANVERPLPHDLDDLTRALNRWTERWHRPRIATGTGRQPQNALLTRRATATAAEPSPHGLPTVRKTTAEPALLSLAQPGVATAYEHGGSVGYVYVAYPYGITTISVEGWRFLGESDSTADYWVGFAHQESIPGTNLGWPGGWRTAELKTVYSRDGSGRALHRCLPNTDTGDSDSVSFNAGWPPGFAVTYSKPDVSVYNESYPPRYAAWKHRYDIFKATAQTYHYASPTFEQTVSEAQPFQVSFSGTAQWRKTLWGLFLWDIENWILPSFRVTIDTR